MIENSEKRESVYPLFALQECLRVAEAVRDLGGARDNVPKSVLAQHLRLAESSASFAQRVGATKTFKLIEGHGSYFLTETAKRYFYPTEENQKFSALLEILSAPHAFNVIIRKFDGDKLPKTEMLGNILHKEGGVPISWKDRIASFFVKSAENVGVIDSQGFLRIKASGHFFPAISAANQKEGASVVPPKREAVEVAVSSGDGLSDVWDFSYKGKSVHLVTPAEIEKPLWEKLNAYIQLLKPDASHKK